MLDDTLAPPAPADAVLQTVGLPAWRAESREAAWRWSNWVAEHRLPAAFLAGLIATHVATVIGIWMPSIGLPRLDWSTTNGLVYLPHTSTGVQFLTGGIFHYTDGIVFSLLFAILLHPALPWPSSPIGNVLKGLAFGAVLSVITCLWMVPRVYAPALHIPHPGFFSANLGWKFTFAVFLWHVVYGFHLGVIFNPARRRPVAN